MQFAGAMGRQGNGEPGLRDTAPIESPGRASPISRQEIHGRDYLVRANPISSKIFL
jgi:hypothetical protein